jgi:hypothetical protein
MDTGDASRRRFGLVTRVNVRITETTFPLVRAYPRALLAESYNRSQSPDRASPCSTSIEQDACLPSLAGHDPKSHLGEGAVLQASHAG